MIRLFLYFLSIAVFAAGFAWFADRPGVVVVNWLGYEAETSVFRAAVLLIVTFAVLSVLGWLAVHLWNSPGRMARQRRERQRRRGYAAIQHGMFAVGAGDEAMAARFAAEAKRALPNEPLTNLLRAQSAQLSGDRAAARRIFESLLANPQTKLLGLRGLYLEARREGHMEAARQLAGQAFAAKPALAWSTTALFELQCKEGDWQGALATLAIARQQKSIGKKTASRRRAVLLTAQAMQLEEREQGKALELALEAHRLAPALVPAAAAAGRILAAQGHASKATKILAQTWELSPHPDLALAYAFARPGDSPRDRLNRVKALAAQTPQHAEGRVSVAAAAIEAQEWDEARAALQPLLASRPSARVCTLMARIEGGQHRDAGRVREWLARAMRAPHDPVWMADGAVSGEWAPVSPKTGMLDAFVWAAPAGQLNPQSGAGLLLAELAALERDLQPLAPKVEVRENSSLELAHPAAAVKAAGLEAAGKGVMLIEPASRGADAAAAPPAPLPAARKTGPVVVKEPPSAADWREEKVGAAPAPVQRAFEPWPAIALSRGTPGPGAGVRSTAQQPRPLNPPEKDGARARLIESGAGKEPAKPRPAIFISERPPDDPGPEPADPDEARTPLARYRLPVKGKAGG